MWFIVSSGFIYFWIYLVGYFFSFLMYNEIGIFVSFSSLYIIVLVCEVRVVMVEKVKWKILKWFWIKLVY